MIIIIVGIGGVGGYFGGMLAKHYATNPDVEIYFLSRGEHLDKIRIDGLILDTENGLYTVRPTLATDKVNDLPIADYILLCTKSYDLDATVNQLMPVTGIDTVILPLLNGIDNSARIRQLLPQCEVWDGCCYIVAKIKEPGIIENSGSIHRLLFGFENQTSDRLLLFEKCLKDAGLEARFCENILLEIWKKFFFISSTATLTSYFDVSYGSLLIDVTRKNTLLKILDELLLVGNAEGIPLDNSEKEKLMLQLEKLSSNTTTSMHRDFQKRKNTEVHSLTGIVVELAQKYNLKVPEFKKIYAELCHRANQFPK